MFLHAKSEFCKFKKSCKNDLCQFRHEVIEKAMSDHNAEQVVNNSDNSTNDIEANVDNESDSDVESEEGEDLECEDCGKVSENFDKYIEHRGMGGCAYYCYPCNETFRYEKDLKRHEQRHCK